MSDPAWTTLPHQRRSNLYPTGRVENDLPDITITRGACVVLPNTRPDPSEDEQSCSSYQNAFFFTHGIGVHRERLTAFELALRDADIEQQNLVSISSILPPGCVEMQRQEGEATLHPGEITFTVLARSETNEPGRRVHSSIGLARPSDPSMYRDSFRAPRLWHDPRSKRRLRRGSCSIDAGIDPWHRIRSRCSVE